MKTVKFLLAIFTFGVVMISCTTTQRGYNEDLDDDNTRRMGNRVYVNDPYYGTVVLERDPFTGRYYDITNGFRGHASPYNSWNNNRSYRSSYPRSYNNYPRSYRNNGNGNVQRPSQEQIQKSREEARKKILGNN